MEPVHSHLLPTILLPSLDAKHIIGTDVVDLEYIRKIEAADLGPAWREDHPAHPVLLGPRKHPHPQIVLAVDQEGGIRRHRRRESELLPLVEPSGP